MMRYPDLLLTRQQLGERLGLADEVLSFWIRNGLLIATEGGQGRGSHRKFDLFQVSIGAVLAELRRFGVNIGVLRQFSEVLQRGAAIARSAQCNFWSLADAADLARLVWRFRRDEPVLVHNPRALAEPPAFASRAHYNAYSRSLFVEAQSEDEIFRDTAQNSELHDDFAPIHALAITLDALDPLALDLTVDLNHRAFRYVFDGDKIANWGDSEWIVVASGDEKFDIYRAAKGNDPMQHAGDEVRSGFYLAPGAIFHSVWGDRLQPLLIHEPPPSEERKAARANVKKNIERLRAEEEAEQ